MLNFRSCFCTMPVIGKLTLFIIQIRIIRSEEMIYLHRKIDDFLQQWKSDPARKPVIVKGARQVGKTRSIRQFADNNYRNIIEINFVRDKGFTNITADGYTPESIIRNISRIRPAWQFVPGETLIFFDEIQKFPDIATSLKFFHEDGRYDVICSGSMLGITYQEIESNSVGSKTDYELRSMDFEEFLWAVGYKSDHINDILDHMTGTKPFNDLEMKQFGELFYNYCILGGMPAVVSSFIESGTFSGTLAIQHQLLMDYEEDIQKYAEGLDKARILNVFRQIPVQLAKENKKFQISKVAKGARFKNYWGCIDWLSIAGVINICHCLHTPELPIKGNYEEDKYKLYYSDTGLLVAQMDEESQEQLRAFHDMGVYKGALFENSAGEALVKQGYELFYYKKENSTLEEDFFVRNRNDLVPVEVKAGTNRAKSLRTLIHSSQYPEISYGIKFSANNIGAENNIYTFPYFCCFLLKRYLKHRN